MTRRERKRINRERWRKTSARSSRARFRAAQSETYGPVRFEDQPDRVRARGRRGLNRGAGRVRRADERPRRSSSGKKRRASSSARPTGWASDFALGRAWGVRAPKGMRGKKARRFVAREGLRKSRAAAGRRLSYNQLMEALSGTTLKAWVCAGPRRTGCGGGRKRYGGARQIGVLKP